MVIDYNLHG